MKGLSGDDEMTTRDRVLHETNVASRTVHEMMLVLLEEKLKQQLMLITHQAFISATRTSH